MNKRLSKTITTLAVTGTLALGLAGCSAGNSNEFKPSLDTDAQVELDVVGYFGNFEALDQVVADFNKTYPNVTVNYQQVGGDNEKEFLEENPDIDLFMTSEQTLEDQKNGIASWCTDLGEAQVDTSAIRDDMLASSQINDKQLSIPMGTNIYGVVANKTLLEKEGLSVPTNQQEFIDTLKALKDKGYKAPIQGPESKIYAELTAAEAFSTIGKSDDLKKALAIGDTTEAKKQLAGTFDLIDQLNENKLIDEKTNSAYPEDNYDGAILSFFEGDVPFWVCNTEKVSGMKKRESKSETFQADPFEYVFINVPAGDQNEYVYQEPWFGFAVNEKSKSKDYATEFLRFMATSKEINTLSSVKGIPSVAKEPESPEIYADVLSDEAQKNAYINDGSITYDMTVAWYSAITKYAEGKYPSVEAALEDFTKAC